MKRPLVRALTSFHLCFFEKKFNVFDQCLVTRWFCGNNHLLRFNYKNFSEVFQYILKSL